MQIGAHDVAIANAVNSIGIVVALPMLPFHVPERLAAGLEERATCVVLVADDGHLR